MIWPAVEFPSLFFQEVNVVVLDSGGYEVLWETSGNVPWDGFDYRQFLAGIRDHVSNLVVVNFDRVGPLEMQITEAMKDFGEISGVAKDFLVKPVSGDQNVVGVALLMKHSAELSHFDLIGITAEELGNSFMRRCRSIVILRDLLNSAGLDTPIHIFGAISPDEVIAYFLCGADVFDGLGWLRWGVRQERLAVVKEIAAEKPYWSLTDDELRSLVWKENLRFLFRLQEELRRYASNGNLAELISTFPRAALAAEAAKTAGAEIR